MKRIILFLLGLIPLALGFLMNSWLMQNQNSVLPFKLIGIIFLVFWVLIGFTTCRFEETPLKSAMISNLSAFVMLLLVMYQEIILGQYWANMLGITTQFFYLPLINISTSIVGIVPWVIRVWSTSLIAFLLMFSSYYLGSYLKRRQST